MQSALGKICSQFPPSKVDSCETYVGQFGGPVEDLMYDMYGVPYSGMCKPMFGLC